MASTITLTVKVNKTELKTLEDQIKKINNTPIEIKATVPADIKKFATDLSSVAKNLEQVTANLKATSKAQTDAIRAEAELKRANDVLAVSENQVKKATEDRIKAENDKVNTANRRAAAEASANARVQVALQKTAQAEQKTQQEVLKTERAVSKASATWQRMFSALSVSNLISSGVTRAISRMRQAFHEALDEMKQLDTALTHYRQVTGASEGEASIIGQQSYTTASKYGTSAADYAESIATYARAGYKEASDELAELSLKTVIVGQTTQEVADQFLLTMDAAYKYGGSVEKLSKVLDGASAIDSTYATTIEKIASGLGLVAPLAAQVHVSEEELTAAIGTITAATQRSGAESARALRSLFLNILGDTTTEIEDGVTATEESVKDLHAVLQKYASSAVEAAEATGKVIDPMEAIGALHESIQQGFLNETELMDLLSSLGGKLRVSQLVALVSHWDDYLKMIDTYQNSMGSANEKVTTYLDSWEAKTNVLKNTWTEFVANTLSTKAIKGIIDGLSILLRSVGNLGNALKILAAAFTAVKLGKAAANARTLAQTYSQATASITKGIVALNQEKLAALQAGDVQGYLAIKEQQSKLAHDANSMAIKAETASMKALALTIGTVLITAITTAIFAWNTYIETQAQATEQAASKQADIAKESMEASAKIGDLYAKYKEAEVAQRSGKGSVEEYQAATEALCKALGIEVTSLKDVGDEIDRLSQKQLVQSLEESKRAADLARAAFVTKTRKVGAADDIEQLYNDKGDYVWNGKKVEYQYSTEEERFQRTVDYYKSLPDLIEEARKAEDWQEVSKLVALQDKYADTLGTVVEQEDNAAEAKKRLNAFMSGQYSALEQEAEDAEDLADANEKAAETFSGLAKAVNEANEALKNYQALTQAEKSDTYSGFAGAWKKAYEDIQKGMVGSNNVMAALDLFFTPEQIMRMRERGLDAAKIISDDFWKSIFTYTDENGAMQFMSDGAEAAATLAYKLYDDFTEVAPDGSRAIRDANNHIIASFEEVDGALSVSVEDFDALAKVMSQKYDISIDPDVLAAMMEALGMFSSKSQETAEGIRNIAQEAQALNENGKIDLGKLIQGELDAGKPTQEVANLLDNIVDLHKEANNGIEIDVGTGSLDEAIQKAKDLITNRDDFSAKDAEAEANLDSSEAERKFKTLDDMAATWNKTIVSARAYMETAAAISAIYNLKNTYETIRTFIARNPIRIVTESQSKTTKSAEGQRNFRGGLSLINEKGAELIVEGDSARIAGEGQPTLTYLQQGADVYTASETKAILGNTDYSYLYDGIGAYAGGRADGITRPTHGGGNNTTDNGNGDTTDNGGQATPSNNNNNNNTTKPTKDKNTKDEELEKLKEKVELRKAELELLQEQGASVKKQEEKQQEVIDAMKKQLEYMEKHNASKKDRVKLETEILKAEKEQKEFELDRIKGVVELRKSELDLLEQQDASIKKQINKNRQIYDTLGKQLKYMKQIGSSQEEINKVKEEQLKIQEDINKLEKDLMGNLETAVDGKISRINDLKKKETDAIQKQIDAIKKENEEEKKATEYQEKQLAVEEAKEKLRNARAERTIRYFNAKTGQWEWKADAQAIKSAKDELDQAKKTLNEAKDDARIAKLEAKQERIEAKRDAQIESWQKVLDSFKDPVISIEKAIKTIEKNATKAQKAEIKALNKLLKPLGYQISTKNLYDSGGVLSGMGGIKATANDEVILPPDITKKMLTPMSSAILSNRLSELRYLYGTTGGNLAGITNNSSIGSQHNGDLYTFGNITLTESQARSTTIYDLAKKSRSLRAYSAM